MGRIPHLFKSYRAKYVIKGEVEQEEGEEDLKGEFVEGGKWRDGGRGCQGC